MQWNENSSLLLSEVQAVIPLTVMTPQEKRDE